MKEKKERKATKENSHCNLNNTKQFIMENYKLTNTHNVFVSGHNVQRKEDFNMKQQIINSPSKAMPDYHKMSIPELKVSLIYIYNIYIFVCQESIFKYPFFKNFKFA